eukprot:482507_1
MSHQRKIYSNKEHGQLYQNLRNAWKIKSKCIVFSEYFKQWIYTHITKTRKKQVEQTVTVYNYGHKWETISFGRCSNNIQPIFIPDEDNPLQIKNNKWANFLFENMINKSLYVSQNLFQNAENESRIQWNVGSILIIFDYENNKWVKGKIKNIFDDQVEYEGR